MSANTQNFVMGPATLYAAPVGSTEPLDSAVNVVPTTPWVDLGATLGGLTLTIAQTYTDLECDQIVDNVGARLTQRSISLKTQLAEPTMANLLVVLNGGTVAGGTSGAPFTYDPKNDSSATQPAYTALLFDGYNGAGLRRRVIVRKALSSDSLDVVFSKDGQQVLPVTFSAFYVSAAVGPFHVADQTASDES